MCRITFQKETVKELRHKLSKAYEAGDLRLVRRVSVLLAVAMRETIGQIGMTWNVSRQTIHNWLEAFVKSRWNSLGYQRPSGRPARLTKSQKNELKELIKAGPEAAGYVTGCWTTVLIQELIFKKFEVLYDRFYVCELLHNLGFSYQKARFVSDHLDEEARSQWMQEEWPRIRNRAKEKKAHLLFGDEASFAQWGSLAYTWAPKGQQPQIKTSGKRKGYKVLGAISFFDGRLLYQGSEDRFNSESYQAFLEYLLAQLDGFIILIQDGAKYHTSKATHDFIAQHADRLEVYQLPSYSPDYNPIEYLWKKVKTKATHNRYFAEFAKLTASVEDALTILASQTDEILRLMGVYTKHLAEHLAA